MSRKDLTKFDYFLVGGAVVGSLTAWTGYGDFILLCSITLFFRCLWTLATGWLEFKRIGQ